MVPVYAKELPEQPPSPPPSYLRFLKRGSMHTWCTTIEVLHLRGNPHWKLREKQIFKSVTSFSSSLLSHAVSSLCSLCRTMIECAGGGKVHPATSTSVAGLLVAPWLLSHVLSMCGCDCTPYAKESQCSDFRICQLQLPLAGADECCSP